MPCRSPYRPVFGGQDVIGRVRDQRRVVVRHPRAVVLDELHQARHHLQVGRDIRVVAEEVDVVERDLDDVLDAVPEPAPVRRISGRRTDARRAGPRSERRPGRHRAGQRQRAERQRASSRDRPGGHPPADLVFQFVHPILLVCRIRRRCRSVRQVTLKAGIKREATGMRSLSQSCAHPALRNPVFKGHGRQCRIWPSPPTSL